jgi:hypothetical protein
VALPPLETSVNPVAAAASAFSLNIRVYSASICSLRSAAHDVLMFPMMPISDQSSLSEEMFFAAGELSS